MALPLDLKAIRPAPGVLVTDLGDELMLLDPDSGLMYSLNETGRFLWRALSAGTAMHAAALLATSHEVEPAVAAADVDAVVRALLGSGLVEERVRGEG